MRNTRTRGGVSMFPAHSSNQITFGSTRVVSSSSLHYLGYFSPQIPLVSMCSCASRIITLVCIFFLLSRVRIARAGPCTPKSSTSFINVRTPIRKFDILFCQGNAYLHTVVNSPRRHCPFKIHNEISRSLQHLQHNVKPVPNCPLARPIQGPSIHPYGVDHECWMWFVLDTGAIFVLSLHTHFHGSVNFVSFLLLGDEARATEIPPGYRELLRE
jgi:hypothetical protein